MADVCQNAGETQKCDAVDQKRDIGNMAAILRDVSKHRNALNAETDECYCVKFSVDASELFIALRNIDFSEIKTAVIDLVSYGLHVSSQDCAFNEDINNRLDQKSGIVVTSFVSLNDQVSQLNGKFISFAFDIKQMMILIKNYTDKKLRQCKLVSFHWTLRQNY